MNNQKSTKPKPQRKATKKDDAASIVGEDMAELLEGYGVYGVVKSNALIEMSETDRNPVSPVQSFLYPKGLSVKAAVAKSLHTQHAQPSVAPKPHSLRRVVRDSVGLRQNDKREALASHFAGILRKSVFGDSEGDSKAARVNPNSVKNIVRGTVGLKPVSEQPTKPKTAREAVRLSTHMQ